MKTLLVTTAGLASALAAHAQLQVGLGPLVGANLATIYNSDGIAYSYRFGALAGAQAELSWGRFSVQPALAFSQLGATRTYTPRAIDPNDPNDPAIPFGTVTHNERFNYLVMPVPVAFCPNGTKTGPQVSAGPYVGILLNSYPTAPRLDTGLQAGLGFRVQNVLLQASYLLSLRAFKTADTNGYSSANYNCGFQASASYLFCLGN